MNPDVKLLNWWTTREIWNAYWFSMNEKGKEEYLARWPIPDSWQP